jgi:hypothetical protein
MSLFDILQFTWHGSAAEGARLAVLCTEGDYSSGLFMLLLRTYMERKT